MRVNLITNGTLITTKKAKELARAGLASAQVSIESPYASEHDSITGVPVPMRPRYRDLKP